MITPAHVIRTLLVFTLLCSSFTCQATLIDGTAEFVDFEEGDSWVGTWFLRGFPILDFLAIRIHPDSGAIAGFENPGIGNFSDSTFTTPLAGDWEHVATKPFLTAASGTARSDLGWNTLFEQERSVPFTHEVSGFFGDQLKFSFAFVWPGFGSISGSPSDWAPTRAEIDSALAFVPLPGTFTLSAIGLSLAGFCRWRMSTGEQRRSSV